ncbi:hypothetical protein MTR67_043375 [Solanum verrucosum]|uniref:Uncharacterized protein n=1 Tax=Solanum verrucosum TaxID=315347 RepID=A0AAF0UNZ1_SOLVR|nr:hypothetical protein MTR67_043375 [Solanum verrucosum]
MVEDTHRVDKELIREVVETEEMTWVDLVILDMLDFDVILGMNWLSPHFYLLNLNAKTITREITGRKKFEWEGVYKSKTLKIISFLRASKLVGQGCMVYLAHLRDVIVEFPSIESIPVVSEFLEVFPTDLPSIPSDRDIDFYINLDLSTRPIYIPPYQMAQTELREIKTQLQQLLDKGFIRPGGSPWGASVLFVKKNHGSIRMCIDYQ